MTPPYAHSASCATLAAALVGLLGAGCASVSPPAAGESRGMVPDLTGQSVVVMPVQLRGGVSGDLDAELAFALEGRAGAVDWKLPPELRRELQASPGLDAPLEGLPVGVFLETEVRRIGDPVYGVLRRLGGLTGADVALVPVAVVARGPVEDAPEQVEVSAALIDVRTGRVLWYGVEAGPGRGDDPAALAGAMDALVRRLAPAGVAR